MKILMAGDTHGDFRNVKHKIDIAKKVGDIQRIVILGDFGLWWGHQGVQFLDDINDYARENNVHVFAIPGNHENHEAWEAMVSAPQATSSGFAYVRTNVLLSPKVHDFVWAGKQFVVAGGAVSIDKAYRLEYEAAKKKKIWSPKEQLLDAQVDQITGSRFGHGVKVDYLLTHDCSNMTPWKTRLKPDADSQIHRQRIDEILRAIQPVTHFHGHMHERYDWMNRTGDNDTWTQTYGLECNSDLSSWGVLDLSDDSFTWSTDYYSEWNRADFKPDPLDDNF